MTVDAAHQSLSLELRQDAPIPLDLSLVAESNELLVLTGPSGGGKTTILRAIAGLTHPTAGHIAIGSTVWLDTARNINLAPQARRVGLVFQDYALFPHMTAVENVATALHGMSPTSARTRARNLLDRVNLAGLEDRRPDALSGGQRQRVAVARALARDPAVLLLDEPFSAVDQATRRRLQRELLMLRRQLSIPTILVTHDLREAASLADRIALVHRGTILDRGTPARLFAKPISPQAARLLDMSNIFTAKVLGMASSAAPPSNTQSGEQFERTVRLDWQGLPLEVETNSKANAGDDVDWVVPGGGVVLHRRDRPSRGERENPVPGTVVEMIPFGDHVDLVVAPTHAPDLPLRFQMPLHTATRNGVAPGVSVTVSLLASAIHVMQSSRKI